jgi:hypothetical protein
MPLFVRHRLKVVFQRVVFRAFGLGLFVVVGFTISFVARVPLLPEGSESGLVSISYVFLDPVRPPIRHLDALVARGTSSAPKWANSASMAWVSNDNWPEAAVRHQQPFLAQFPKVAIVLKLVIAP